MATVVVVFWSRLGSTERLALAAAVGAVQQRATIRLRWLGEQADDAAIDRVPGWRENRERMSQEYIAPREIDIEGADCLVLLTPSHIGPDANEWRAFFELVRRVGASKGKPAASASVTLFESMRRAGLTVIPAPLDDAATEPSERARSLGQLAAKACR
jgi:flavodoxin